MDFGTIKDAFAIGGFFLSVAGIIGGWIYWRATVTNHVGRLSADVEKLTGRVDDIHEQHVKFEAQVTREYVTYEAFREIRTAMDAGFRSVTDRIDRMFSSK